MSKLLQSVIIYILHRASGLIKLWFEIYVQKKCLNDLIRLCVVILVLFSADILPNSHVGRCSCNLLGALRNTTPSSGEISFLDKSSVQTETRALKQMTTFALYSPQHEMNLPFISELSSFSATFLSKKDMAPGRFSVPMCVNKIASTLSRWRTSFQKQA